MPRHGDRAVGRIDRRGEGQFEIRGLHRLQRVWHGRDLLAWRQRRPRTRRILHTNREPSRITPKLAVAEIDLRDEQPVNQLQRRRFVESHRQATRWGGPQAKLEVGRPIHGDARVFQLSLISE